MLWLIFVCLFVSALWAEEKKIMKDTSRKGVCSAYPERVKKLFNTLDLERKGLEKVLTGI